jgi:hypothetical protein
VTAAYGAAIMDKNREIALLKQQVDALKHAVEDMKKGGISRGDDQANGSALPAAPRQRF